MRVSFIQTGDVCVDQCLYLCVISTIYLSLKLSFLNMLRNIDGSYQENEELGLASDLEPSLVFRRQSARVNLQISNKAKGLQSRTPGVSLLLRIRKTNFYS